MDNKMCGIMGGDVKGKKKENKDKTFLFNYNGKM